MKMMPMQICTKASDSCHHSSWAYALYLDVANKRVFVLLVVGAEVFHVFVGVVDREAGSVTTAARFFIAAAVALDN